MCMIKRILSIWMLLVGLCMSACAEPYIYSSDQTPLVFFDCEDFDEAIPAKLEGVFDEWLEDGDRVLSGTVCATRYHSWPEEMHSGDALLTLERDGRILLLGAAYRDGAWCSAVETDAFFALGQRFDVTCVPRHGMSGTLVGVRPSLVYGSGEFIVNVLSDARVLLEEYCVPCPDSSELCIRIGSGNMHASRTLDGIEQESAKVRGVFGRRLRNWTCDAFPKTCAQVNALEGVGMPEFAEGEALISGVNLREQPTGQSPSMGKYTAIVRILDRREGTHAPWYQVQFEDKTGWVSGDYVLFPEHEPHLSQIALYLSDLLDQ